MVVKTIKLESQAPQGEWKLLVSQCYRNWRCSKCYPDWLQGLNACNVIPFFSLVYEPSLVLTTHLLSIK